MLKTYTITQNGTSGGNVIAQPFTIEVHAINNYSGEGGDRIILDCCTKNGSGNVCANDDIPNHKEYFLSPTMGVSKSADLVATLEADLEAAYPGNWS